MSGVGETGDQQQQNNNNNNNNLGNNNNNNNNGDNDNRGQQQQQQQQQGEQQKEQQQEQQQSGDNKQMVVMEQDSLEKILESIKEFKGKNEVKEINLNHLETTVKVFTGKSEEWLDWKNRMLNFAGSRRVAKYFIKDLTKELNAGEDLKEQDEALLCSLKLLISSNKTLEAELNEYQTVFDAWNYLIARFESQPELAILELKRKLASFKIGEDERNIIDKIEELRTIRQRLLNAGVTINENEFVQQVNEALPRRWEQFKSSVRHTATMYKTTFAFTGKSFGVRELFEMIRVEDASKKLSSEHNHHHHHHQQQQHQQRRPEVGYHVDTRGTGDRKPDVYCKFCNMNNHSTEDCTNKFKQRQWQGDSSSKASTSSTPKDGGSKVGSGDIRCYRCGKVTDPPHISRNCPTKTSNNKPDASASSSSSSIKSSSNYSHCALDKSTCETLNNNFERNDHDELYDADDEPDSDVETVTDIVTYSIDTKKSIVESNGVRNNIWYIDSAASRHVTSNRDLLTNIKSINDIKVRMANGYLVDAQCVGDV
jgi:hypothetical protein